MYCTKTAERYLEELDSGISVDKTFLSSLFIFCKSFRVLCSKRRFDEHQAEEWWNSKKDRLLKKYSHHVSSSSPRVSDSVPTPTPPQPPAPPTLPNSDQGEDIKEVLES